MEPANQTVRGRSRPQLSPPCQDDFLTWGPSRFRPELSPAALMHGHPAVNERIWPGWGGVQCPRPLRPFDTKGDEWTGQRWRSQRLPPTATAAPFRRPPKPPPPAPSVAVVGAHLYHLRRATGRLLRASAVFGGDGTRGRWRPPPPPGPAWLTDAATVTHSWASPPVTAVASSPPGASTAHISGHPQCRCAPWMAHTPLERARTLGGYRARPPRGRRSLPTHVGGGGTALPAYLGGLFVAIGAVPG